MERPPIEEWEKDTQYINVESNLIQLNDRIGFLCQYALSLEAKLAEAEGKVERLKKTLQDYAQSDWFSIGTEPAKQALKVLEEP